ncbi:NAD(P)H-binding protein [Nocardia brasiliensis]|uniref:NAD(P)H-binding protein n=1 Tax=Nocardia brasiliensis TaxID=37326 RepID=UPI0024574BF4|nr:NAD(P)H-binding protein [Nocardia brasiliensis]
MTSTPDNFPPHLTLVTSVTGKTGSRVADRLETLGLAFRPGSRSAEIPFDWSDRATWEPALAGVDAVYLAFHPDLAATGAPDIIEAFVKAMESAGIPRVVLLSGRGEPEAEECENLVRNSGLGWTILRCNWFSQNFNEGGFLDYILAGIVTLPARDVPEPFIDADDIADVAIAALTDAKHLGEIYELSGPRGLTFAEATAEIGAALGREIVYAPSTRQEFIDSLNQYQMPLDQIDLLDYLFHTILDGRNSSITDGVERALGRKPRDFADFARAAAASGVWNSEDDR